MARKVSLGIDDPVSWPARCARCGSQDALTASSVSIGSVRSVGVGLGGVALNSTMATLKYPVCRQHAAGLGLAAVVTRRTGGFRFLRGFIYLIAVPGTLTFVVILARWIGFLAPLRNDQSMPLPFVAMLAAAIAATAYLVYAFRKLPVRLVGQSKETVTIRFSNDDFAARFVAQNRRNLREVPWWKKFVL